MRPGIGIVLVSAALAAALAGCTSQGPEPAGSDPEAGSAPWPTSGMPGYYMVSAEIQEYCPNGEEYLGGTQITDVIPPEQFDALEGYACVFGAPESGGADEVDEFAYRIDEGLGDLVRAYSETTYAVDGECAEPIPVEAVHPHVRVEYEGVGYTLTVAGCGSAEVLDDVVAGIRVTEVARDTVTFAEYEESGL